MHAKTNHSTEDYCFKTPYQLYALTWMIQICLILSDLEPKQGQPWLAPGWETIKEFQGCYAEGNGKLFVLP